MKKVLTAITLSLALIFTSALPILASDSNINETNLVPVTVASTKSVKVTKVILNKKTTTLAVGFSEPLFPTVSPSNATNPNVVWKSNNEAIATVDSTGNVTGLKAGKVTITVTTVDRKKTAKCIVTVNNLPVVNVTGVSFPNSEPSMNIGYNKTLSAIVSPRNATNQNVTWKSSNTSVATVDKNGKVVGLSLGSSDITVTSVDGSKTATCRVTVIPVTITSASVAGNGTITITLSNPEYWDYGMEVIHTPMNHAIADFAVTNSGVPITPTSISTTGEVVTLTVPAVVPTATDQVYSVSCKGGDPVVANTQVTNIATNNAKIGQKFNIIFDKVHSDGGYRWTYTTYNEAIKSIQQVYGPLCLPGVCGGESLLIWTFQATQIGSFNLHFSEERSWEGPSSSIQTIDYIINVT